MATYFSSKCRRLLARQAVNSRLEIGTPNPKLGRKRPVSSATIDQLNRMLTSAKTEVERSVLQSALDGLLHRLR